ncbi:MAG: hypothetical protein QXP57_08520 [Nitrososphaerota archaeon]
MYREEYGLCLRRLKKLFISSLSLSIVLLGFVFVTTVIEHLRGGSLLGRSVSVIPYMIFLIACFNTILLILFLNTGAKITRILLGLINTSSIILSINGFLSTINNPLLIVLMILMLAFNIILSILIIKAPLTMRFSIICPEELIENAIKSYIERCLERLIKHINGYEASKNEHI